MRSHRVQLLIITVILATTLAIQIPSGNYGLLIAMTIGLAIVGGYHISALRQMRQRTNRKQSDRLEVNRLRTILGVVLLAATATILAVLDLGTLTTVLTAVLAGIFVSTVLFSAKR